MDVKELDGVFSDAEDKRELSPGEALTMIAKSMAFVADPKTSDDEAKEAMIRCYSFIKSASESVGDDETIKLEKSLVDAVESDGKGARTEPISRAVDAIRKRFNDDKTGDGGDTDDDGEGDGGDGDGDKTDVNKGDGDAGDVRWQHDLNSEPDPDDDWGKDPEF